VSRKKELLLTFTLYLLVFLLLKSSALIFWKITRSCLTIVTQH